MKPLVSIIIPCFKQARLLPQAIDTALAQVDASVEVVVVDDGSPDNTVEVCAKYGDRITLVRKTNAGLPAARNSGILASKGEFLVWLDSDDYLPADFVAKMQNAIEKGPSDVAYCDYRHVDMDGRPLKAFKAVVPDNDVAHQYLLGNMFPPHAAMTRRTALANSGLFDPHLRSFEDWDLWVRLAFSGAHFAKAEGLIVDYRQYPESMSRNAERMRACGMQVLEKARHYHANCPDCARAIRAGEWGLRSHFINVAPGFKDVIRAGKSDPSLFVTRFRDGLRTLKHGSARTDRTSS